MTTTPGIIAHFTSIAIAAIICIGGAAYAQAPEADEDIDLGAKTFVQNCIRCHGGILTGNDLMNTSLSSIENLTETVHRMQEFTAPMSEEQIVSLVELLKDKEVQFRVEEAQLEYEEVPAGSGTTAPGQAAAVPVDSTAALFIKNCATCHTIGPGSSSGGDLTLTISQPEAVVKANVTRMQVRTGPMTTDQIDQLTALLKDQNRNTRLVSAGYKPPVVATPPLTPPPASTPPPTQPIIATNSTNINHPSSQRVLRVSSDQASERSHGIPMKTMVIALGLGALVVVAGFLLAAKDKD